MESISLKFARSQFKLFLRDEVDVSVMREIFKSREYRVVEEIIKIAQQPIVDVGAHVGFFCLYCRAFNKKVPIFAIEPAPDNLACLRDHLQANKIKGIQVVAGALAGKTGKGNLVIASDSHNHCLANDNDEGAVIKTYSLSDFCQRNKIKNISLLKMDIEGGEFDVFERLRADDFLLFKNVILEYHNSRGNNYKEIEIELRENGFGVQVFPSKFDKTMGFIFASNKRGLYVYA